MGDGDEHYGTEKDGRQRPGDDAGVPARAEALEVILICDGNDENKNRPISYRV